MGAYTDIVEIDAPDSAVAGETVPVTIKIKNIWENILLIAADGTYDGVPFLHMEYWVPAGETATFSGSFTMPSSGVTIHASSSYWLFGDIWELDDEAEKAVSLAEVFEGTISRKELEYDEARGAIPVSNVPQGERGLVHIWGRNDMASTQRMGIYWVVKDPDGIVVEEYSAWEAWPYTGPGSSHQFIGGRFNLDKAGTYIINVALSMNPSDPEIVDTYYGDLCTVAAAVPESEFRAFGIEKYQTV